MELIEDAIECSTRLRRMLGSTKNGSSPDDADKVGDDGTDDSESVEMDAESRTGSG